MSASHSLRERPPCDTLIKIKGLSSPCDLHHVKGKESFFHPSLCRLLILQGFALKRKTQHAWGRWVFCVLSCSGRSVTAFLADVGSSQQTSGLSGLRESIASSSKNPLA